MPPDYPVSYVQAASTKEKEAQRAGTEVQKKERRTGENKIGGSSRERRQGTAEQRDHLNFTKLFFSQLESSQPTLKKAGSIGRGVAEDGWKVQGKRKEGRNDGMVTNPPPTLPTRESKNTVIKNTFSHPEISKCMLDENGKYGPEKANENGEGDKNILQLFSCPRTKKPDHPRRKGGREKKGKRNKAAPAGLKRTCTEKRREKMRFFTLKYAICYRKKYNPVRKHQSSANAINSSKNKTSFDDYNIGGKFYCPILLNGAPATSWLDSGADVSICPQGVLNDLNIDLKNCQTVPPIQLRSYTQHTIKAKCAVWLNLGIGKNFCQRHLFLVTAENTHHVILSKMFIREFEVGIQWEDGECYLNVPTNVFLEKEKKTQLKERYKENKLNPSSAPPPLPNHGASAPPPRSRPPKAGEREAIKIRFEINTLKVANVDKIEIKSGRKRIVAVDLLNYSGKLPKKIIITPIEGIRHPIVFSPSLSCHCRCRKNCPHFMAEISNVSAATIKIGAGNLRADAEIFVEEMHAVIDTSTVLGKLRDGSPTIKSKIFQRFCGRNNLQAEIHQLTLKEEKENTFEIKPGDEPLFEETLPFAEIDPQTGYPISPPHYSSPQEAIPWEKYGKEYVHHIHHIFVERCPGVVSLGFYDAGNVSEKGLGKAKLITSGPPKGGKLMYPMSQAKKLSLLKLLRGMAAVGWIDRVISAHGSPVFIIPRKEADRPGRLLINLQNVNEVCVHSPVALLSSPLQKLQALAGAKMFSQIDLKQGFFSIEMEEESAQRCILNSDLGQFKMNRLSQGAQFSPALYAGFLSAALYDNPITGKLESYNVPLIFGDERKNPFSNLASFVTMHVDDCILSTPEFDTPQQTREFHATILARVVDKLDRYTFKISMEKSNFFVENLDVLGMKIKEGKIYPDPKRFEDISRSVFPTSRNNMLAFCSLVGTIRHAMSLRSHAELAKLYDLTSIKTEYKPTEEHRKAFENLKKELASEPLVVTIPTNKPKLLFTDASEKLIGAALFDVDFHEPLRTKKKEEEEEKSRPFSIYDKLGKKIYKFCSQKDVRLSKTDIKGDGNCFISSVLDQIDIYGFGKNYPQNARDFRTLLCTFLSHHKSLERETEEIRAATCGRGWREYVKALNVDHTPSDELNVLIRGTADLLGRDIHIITDNQEQPEPIIFRSAYKKVDLPPLFLGFYEGAQRGSVGHYCSIYVARPNILTKSRFTSCSEEKSWRDLSQDELFLEIKKLWMKKCDTKPIIRPIGYMTRTIGEGQRDPIYVKELRALLESLHQYREILECSPVTIVLVDSRALWCLLNNTVTATVHKIHRWGVTLRGKYKNIIFKLIKSEENLADFLSRQFVLEDIQPERLQLRENFTAPLPNAAGGLLTVDEAHEIANKNPDFFVREEKTEMQGGAAVNSLSLDRLSEMTLPIRELREKLDPQKVIKAQKEELSDEYRTALSLSPSKQKTEFKYVLLNGLLAIQTEKGESPKIYVPPSMEGLVIAYFHLISGHRLGRQGLFYTLNSNYFFPRLRYKASSFSSLCLNCTLMGGIKDRKATIGRTIVPRSPFDVLYADVVTLSAKTNKTTADYLVIVDAFSKFIQVFPLSKMTEDNVIKHFQTFFSHVGLLTTHLVADNATIFRGKKVLSFFSKLSIRVVHSSAWRSQARGQVEIFNFLLRRIISALVMNKNSYQFREILFLIQILMNNSLNLSTKSAPSEVIFGRKTINTEGFGLDLKPPILYSSLINSSLAADIKQLRKTLDKIWSATADNLEKIRKKQEERFNKTARNKVINEGDLVFLLDRRLPQPGTSKKLDPPLQKSPFLVEKVFDKVVDVIRVTDKFRTRVHQNSVKLIKNMDPQDPLFIALPQSVRDEIGRPLTTEALKDLAEKDTLPLLLREDFYRFQKGSGSGVETRAARRKREKEEQDLEQVLDTEPGDEWEWLNDDILPKNVSFE